MGVAAGSAAVSGFKPLVMAKTPLYPICVQNSSVRFRDNTTMSVAGNETRNLEVCASYSKD